MTLTPERWKRARDVLHEAMQMDEEERSDFLDSQCASDPSLRVELEELLAAEGEIGSNFLEEPALAQAALRTDKGRHTVLPSGTKLGPYVVHSLIGAGGMGEVYRARDASLKRDVAIKVLPVSVSGDPERLRRFQLEAEAAAALNHPNILSIFHIGQQDGSPYIVTELLEGETLRERLRHGALRLRDAIDAAIHTAKGLATAHEKGIAHRDLKPENLFLAKDGRVKILDFGLAKLMQPASSDSDGPTMSLRDQTDAGRVLGTVGYMSPEQVRGEPADARSDLFSLGCVLYEMLTGKRAFRKATAVETMNAILTEDPPAATEITRAIPPALQRVIQRCLEKGPERRFQSASDLAFALDALSETGRGSARPIVLPSQGRAALWVAGAVVLVLLVGGIVAGYRYLPIKRAAPSWQEWEQLTDFPDAVGAPALSPDGKMLAFLRGPGTFLTTGDLYVKMLPRGEPVQLTHQDKNKMTPAFSPDGSQIAYTTDPPWDTWIVPVLGGEPRLMLPNAASLTWIDNQHVLFSEIKSGLHMAVVTATEGRAGQRDVYVPPLAEGMAHHSYISHDHKWVLIAEEMTTDGSGPCRIVPFDDGSSRGRLVGPHARCNFGAWSPDGKWIYLSAWTKDGFHLWRQAFPDGEPEQITFGPSEQEGVAVTPDGKSLLSSVGFQLRTVWVHSPAGDRQIAFNGSASLPNSEISSRAVFTPDGNQLIFLGRRSGEHAVELWRADLHSGRVEPLVPGTALAGTFDVSPDGTKVVFASFDARGKSSLWLAWLDRRSPPHQFDSDMSEGLPVFGPGGELYYQAQVGTQSFLYSRPVTGGIGKRVTNHPVIRFETISADGKWLVADSPIFGEESLRGAQAFNVENGATMRICYSLCELRWSDNGKFLYISLPGNRSAGTSGFTTFIVPLRSGRSFPDLPAKGIRSETDLQAIGGVKKVDDLLHPGRDDSHYAFERNSDHRNIYRIPIPN